MGGADTRGFAYVLEPVRRKREWELDAALAQVGKLHQQLCEREAERDALREECASQAMRISQAWMVHPDPAAQGRLLGYLFGLHSRSASAQREAQAVSEALRRARGECANRQQALDALDEDRAGTLKAYTVDEIRRSSAQADQDWIARHSQGCAREDGR